MTAFKVIMIALFLAAMVLWASYEDGRALRKEKEGQVTRQKEDSS